MTDRIESEIKNKRWLERFDLKIPAKIETATHDPGIEDKMGEILTSDICSGGAFFHTAQPLPVGTEVKIDLVLPLENMENLDADSRHSLISLKGKVLRSSQEGMAIGFYGNYQITPLTGNRGE